MSIVDLATLARHRKYEMETRINSFISKCDYVTNEIKKLKLQSQGFVHQLDCDPSELRTRFLDCMKKLDEYLYVITDFHIALNKLEEDYSNSLQYLPVHDNSYKALVTTPTLNLMDMLSEPAPSSTTSTCTTCCGPQVAICESSSKAGEVLIKFSSSSNSAESVPGTKVEKQVQCDYVDNTENPSLTAIERPPCNTEVRSSTQIVLPENNDAEKHPPDQSVPLQTDIEQKKLALPSETAQLVVDHEEEEFSLPAQTVLPVDHVYNAVIVNVDGVSLWVITEDTDKAFEFMVNMTKYYKNQANSVEFTMADVATLTYCAYFDVETDCYYRALIISIFDEENTLELYLMDTGEMRISELSYIKPLVPQFCNTPPFARCCHLAGVEFMSNCRDKDLELKLEEFTKKFIGSQCQIEVDDNTSESLGVYVRLADGTSLNEAFLVKARTLMNNEDVEVADGPSARQQTGPPEIQDFDDSDNPEYEDPVEAVTGYSCRDEADICKHYKGPPAKTCFKGAMCKKKHIMKHPDGWTLDQVEVPAIMKFMALPAPDTWHKVRVTCVCHFDRVFVQFVKDATKAELSSFGVVLPPASLESLVLDMNSPAARMSYKPLKICPAPGELVAAIYPQDEQWYRAKVIESTRADQCVQVMYIDYGNVVWVREDCVRELEPRYLALPAQAVQCRLAGVAARGHNSAQWAAAKQALSDMVLERTLDAHVIARNYDEIDVELIDQEGYNVAELLAARTLVTLHEYEVQNDSNVRQKLVVP